MQVSSLYFTCVAILYDIIVTFFGFIAKQEVK